MVHFVGNIYVRIKDNIKMEDKYIGCEDETKILAKDEVRRRARVHPKRRYHNTEYENGQSYLVLWRALVAKVNI